MKKEKYLFLCDLDGTLLNNSSESTISDIDKEAIARLRAEGHIFAIATGRPWAATKKPYEALGLDTVIANYNGAQIHNPTDYDFSQQIEYMNLNDVMYILGDKKIQAAMSNLAIEGPGWVMLEHRDEPLERIFGFRDAGKFKLGIDFHKIPLKPTGVIFDTKKGVNVLELKDYLERTYGDLAEFSSWSKGEGLTPVFDITNLGVTKAKAIA
ncbi:MAG: HAD-IIB family hydrolase, partial [Mycoplasmataceae bacterium]|nr:HAD-IIB family hydrolase [Mycoplasmataceae bacterium]